MRTFRNVSVAAVCALVFVTSLQAREGNDHQALRQSLEPVYQQLKTDPQFEALRLALAADAKNQTVVDRYLSYLPLSPVEMLEMEMKQQQFEIMIPAFLHAWHERWVELREPLARAQYGDAYVDHKLGRKIVKPPTENGAQLDDGAATTATRAATVGINRNVASTLSPAPERYQGEVQLVVNPNNPDQIVAGTNTLDTVDDFCPGFTQAVFYSNDGGTTWGYTCTPGTTSYAELNCPIFEFGSDPALAWNTENEVFFEHMLLCTSDGINFGYAMVIAISRDGGATWDAQGVIANSFDNPNFFEDKEFLAIDNYPNSPFFGRMYTCWGRKNDEHVAYSTDKGQTWTQVDLPTTPGPGNRLDLGCELEVERDGTLHIAYTSLTCPDGLSCIADQKYYSQSTDGAVTWRDPVLVHDFNMVAFNPNSCPDAQASRCIGGFGAIGMDNSRSPCDGHLYIVYTDFTTGDANNADIWVTRSSDDGVTWSDGVKVNDDGFVDRTQFNAFLVVDQLTGHPVVAWHDARNDPNNRSIDYFISRSLDCGQSFEANIQLSQPSAEFSNSDVSSSNTTFVDNPDANPNQYGEYLGLDVYKGKAFVGWLDTRQFFPIPGAAESQDENMGFARVDFGYTLALPKPGVAGRANRWVTVNSTPGERTFFVFGTKTGSKPVPGCPGVTFGIRDIHILATDRANADGVARARFRVPAGVAGQDFLFQAVELSTCEVSNVYTYSFQ
ncbi:MAG: sialidase family protein [Acidobacteriota bacterium]